MKLYSISYTVKTKDDYGFRHRGAMVLAEDADDAIRSLRANRGNLDGGIDWIDSVKKIADIDIV